MGHVAGEFGLLRWARQIAVEEQPSDLKIVAALDELIDRVPAIEQHTLVAIDIGDRRTAGAGFAECRVVGPIPGFLAQPAGIDHRRPERRLDQRQFGAAIAARDLDRRGSGGHRSLHRHICRGRLVLQCNMSQS